MNNRILVSGDHANLLSASVEKDPASLLLVDKADLADALIRALTAQTVVKFSYVKKDGTVREAYGSISSLIIPVNHMPKAERWAIEKDNPSPLSLGLRQAHDLNYFDLTQMEWRKVTFARLLTVEV